MNSLRRLKRALRDALTLDLFGATARVARSVEEPGDTMPTRRTLHSPEVAQGLSLPTIEELQHRYQRYNAFYFEGTLPPVRIEYSSRMFNAGSYTPSLRLIRIGRKYHELFPEDVDDTLRHEMIHVRNPSHDAAFKREAKRLGASLKGKSHPSLMKPPRYLYECPECHTRFARQKRLRLASCGHCSAEGKYDERFKLRLLKPHSSPSS